MRGLRPTVPLVGHLIAKSDGAPSARILNSGDDGDSRRFCRTSNLKSAQVRTYYVSVDVWRLLWSPGLFSTGCHGNVSQVSPQWDGYADILE